MMNATREKTRLWLLILVGVVATLLGQTHAREIFAPSPHESGVFATQTQASTGENYDGIQYDALDSLLAANRTASQIDGKKFDYLFGRATGRQHNLDRTNQNALEMKRLGVPDTAEGHAMLSSHLDDAVQGNANINRNFDNEWGSFEVRESLFPGPSGKFSMFESTWQVLPDGSRRFSSLIPMGGGN